MAISSLPISTTLPLPTTDAIAHSDRLRQHILKTIEKNHGFISFADYMDLALYSPGLGYYVAGTEKFNHKGDFITAPEISSLFSACLAKQCQQILATMGHLADILEFGAGTGRMAADILMALQQENCSLRNYFILELSPELKKRQQETIHALCPELLPQVQWLNQLPIEFSGIMLANEVLDAMPAHRFQLRNGISEEIGVTAHQGILQLKAMPTQNSALLDFFNQAAFFHAPEWPSLYTSEVNLNIKPWISSLSQSLQQGVILLIDYGFPKAEYYHPQRNTGTLRCHYRHQVHNDPFYYPGLQDITAHVDFSEVYAAALLAGLDVLGYTEQASFLLACGLIALVNAKNLILEKEKAQQNHAIQLLTSPAEMGELVKVIALGKKVDEPLVGFSIRDKQHKLL